MKSSAGAKYDGDQVAKLKSGNNCRKTDSSNQNRGQQGSDSLGEIAKSNSLRDGRSKGSGLEAYKEGSGGSQRHRPVSNPELKTPLDKATEEEKEPGGHQSATK